jgi:hypothetical protein
VEPLHHGIAFPVTDYPFRDDSTDQKNRISGSLYPCDNGDNSFLVDFTDYLCGLAVFRNALRSPDDMVEGVFRSGWTPVLLPDSNDTTATYYKETMPCFLCGSGFQPRETIAARWDKFFSIF